MRKKDSKPRIENEANMFDLLVNQSEHRADVKSFLDFIRHLLRARVAILHHGQHKLRARKMHLCVPSVCNWGGGGINE